MKDRYGASVIMSTAQLATDGILVIVSALVCPKLPKWWKCKLKKGEDSILPEYLLGLTTLTYLFLMSGVLTPWANDWKMFWVYIPFAGFCVGYGAKPFIDVRKRALLKGSNFRTFSL